MKASGLLKMSRRRFVQNLQNIGASAAAVPFLTQDALAELDYEPDEEVPRISRFRHTNHEGVKQGEKPQREPVFYTIPRDKWAVVETAHDAAEKVDSKLESVDNSGLLSVGVRTFTKGQHPQKTVNIRYSVIEDDDGRILKRPDISLDELKALVPDTVSGVVGKDEYRVEIEDIPTNIMRRSIPAGYTPLDTAGILSHGDSSGGARSDYHYDYEYRPIPGGCSVGNIDTDEAGTAATPAYDNQVEEYVLTTVCHLNNGNEGDDITQHAWNGQVGLSDKCAFSQNDMDAATIQIKTDKHGNYDSKYAFAEDDGTYTLTEIYGVLAWDTIKDNEGNSSYNMQWRGSKSGHTGDTHIVETNTDKYFWVNQSPEQGDSGGPMYHVKFSGGNGRAYISGIVAQGTDGDDDGDADCGGPWMGDVESKFNLNV